MKDINSKPETVKIFTKLEDYKEHYKKTHEIIDPKEYKEYINKAKKELKKLKENAREVIKQPKKLPVWFKTSNYEDTKYLTMIGWYNELALRAEYYCMPFEFENIQPVLFYEDENNPLSDKSRKHFFGSSISLDEALITKAEKLDDCSSNHNGQLVFNGLVTKGKYVKKQGSNILIETKLPLLDKQEEPFMVNLLCPDEMLIEKFETWIKRMRKSKNEENSFYNQVKETGRISKISDDELKKWYEFGLLPFLDLHQWALLEHKKILDRVYQLSILPNTNTCILKSERAIKKTTYGIATTILSKLKVLAQQLNT